MSIRKLLFVIAVLLQGIAISLVSHAAASGAAVISAPNGLPEIFNTSRPVRDGQKITITIGQNEGDLRGNDDKAIQSAVDYVYARGGGTVQVLPGTYILRSPIRIPAGITFRGLGENTILKKCASKTVKLVRDVDNWEMALQVDDPTGFKVGDGIMLKSNVVNKKLASLNTITAINGNVLYLEKPVGYGDEDYYVLDSATVTSLFSLIEGRDADGSRVENIVLDGNKAENDWNHNDWLGVVSLDHCNRWVFKNVTAENSCNDGFTFQTSDDCVFDGCIAKDNLRMGFHPGSGDQRPTFRNCKMIGNLDGLYWCWAVSNGLAENCVTSNNKRYGMSIGHRDTDDTFRNCVFEGNEKAGLYFRDGEENTPVPWESAARDKCENCIFRDNGKDAAVDITYFTKDITFANCTFQNTGEGSQKVAIRMGHDVGKVNLENNKFSGFQTNIQDQRAK